MPTIAKDDKSREWDFTITVGTMMEMKARGYSLLDLEADANKGIRQLVTDDSEVMLWAWRVIEPQAKAIDVSESEFYGSLKGASYAAVRNAFIEAYSFFSRSPATQSTLKELSELDQKGEAIKLRVMQQVIEFTRNHVKEQDSQLSDEHIRRLCENKAAEVRKEREERLPKTALSGSQP